MGCVDLRPDAGNGGRAAASNTTVLKSVAGHAFAQTQPSAQQPPQAMKVRLAGGGDAVVTWDPTAQQYVQMPEAANK